MSNLIDIMDAPLLEVWGEAVRARRIQGEWITPVRSDWDTLPIVDGATPRWPAVE